MKWQAICEQTCTIIPVKLRSFYFKFIHRALPCKYTLYKMHIVETEYCQHCYNVPETFMHMFWGLYLCKKLWNIIWKYLSIRANKTFEAGIDSVMLCNIIKKTKSSHLFPQFQNHTCLPTNMQEKYLTQLNVGIRYYTIKIQKKSYT